MKIRNGFVSNSSTTSFCMYGIHLYGYEENLGKIAQNGELSTKLENWDSSIPSEDKIEALQIYVEDKLSFFDSYGDLHIGLSFDEMQPNETKADFEKRSTEVFKSLFKEDFLEHYDMTWIIDTIQT